MTKIVLNTIVGGRKIPRALKNSLDTKGQRLSNAERVPPPANPIHSKSTLIMKASVEALMEPRK